MYVVRCDCCLVFVVCLLLHSLTHRPFSVLHCDMMEVFKELSKQVYSIARIPTRQCTFDVHNHRSVCRHAHATICCTGSDQP